MNDILIKMIKKINAMLLRPVAGRGRDCVTPELTTRSDRHPVKMALNWTRNVVFSDAMALFCVIFILMLCSVTLALSFALYCSIVNIVYTIPDR